MSKPISFVQRFESERPDSQDLEFIGMSRTSSSQDSRGFGFELPNSNDMGNSSYRTLWAEYMRVSHELTAVTTRYEQGKETIGRLEAMVERLLQSPTPHAPAIHGSGPSPTGSSAGSSHVETGIEKLQNMLNQLNRNSPLGPQPVQGELQYAMCTYWTKDDLKDATNRSANSNENGPERWEFITNIAGQFVGSVRLEQMRNEAFALFDQFYYLWIDPEVWGNKLPVVRDFFTAQMHRKFPELRYCNEDWKLKEFGGRKHSEWKQSRDSKARCPLIAAQYGLSVSLPKPKRKRGGDTSAYRKKIKIEGEAISSQAVPAAAGSSAPSTSGFASSTNHPSSPSPARPCNDIIRQIGGQHSGPLQSVEGPSQASSGSVTPLTPSAQGSMSVSQESENGGPQGRTDNSVAAGTNHEESLREEETVPADDPFQTVEIPTSVHTTTADPYVPGSTPPPPPPKKLNTEKPSTAITACNLCLIDYIDIHGDGLPKKEFTEYFKNIPDSVAKEYANAVRQRKKLKEVSEQLAPTSILQAYIANLSPQEAVSTLESLGALAGPVA
ncbi:hypothetical protein FA15DRAFT_706355 [Coprinopsis marcescibilis]|uniref:Uncharacterized protein n=1 Tax=Coprinopsis marcescibilis TaxID=230819 RepID=A0A5C3KQI4_COPMA|nr:hypothetical protein FA15DRAFT_706355 [Coprinopsis marcescibilis]